MKLLVVSLLTESNADRDFRIGRRQIKMGFVYSVPKGTNSCWNKDMNESHLLLPDLHKNGLWEVTADQALFRKKTVIDQNMAPKKTLPVIELTTGVEMSIYSLEIVKFESRSHVWIQTLFLASNNFLNDDWLVFGVFFQFRARRFWFLIGLEHFFD